VNQRAAVMRAASIWIAVLAIMVLGAVRAPIFLGVLEPPIGQSTQFRVRVAFRFADGRWSAMPNEATQQDAIAKLVPLYPAQVSWTIALHGEKLGALSSVRPSEYSSYSEIGLEDLTANSKPPLVREGAAAFAMWMGAPRYRPLPAISEPNYHDPDDWKTFDAPASIRKEAIAAFRREIALDINCDGKATRSYPDSAVQIYGEPYRSNRGDVLIAMRPDPRRNHCDGPVGDEWQSVWFHLKGNDFRWIGNSLTIVDIGDYDGDGAAKVLFQYDGYNRDGYVLFDPRDDSKTEFAWSYH
jgi:hypothetical protein